MTADKVQTISRPSCLTVTVTRFFVVSRLLSAALFPQSVKLIRDIKRRRLFVLSFYHFVSPFATDAAVSKPQETATSVDNSATLRNIFVPFGFGMLGERLGLSKARSNFGGIGKR